MRLFDGVPLLVGRWIRCGDISLHVDIDARRIIGCERHHAKEIESKCSDDDNGDDADDDRNAG